MKRKQFFSMFLAASVVCQGMMFAGASVAFAEENAKTAEAQSGETHAVTDYLGREVEVPVELTRVCVQDAYNMECINVLGCLDTVVGVDYNIAEDKIAWNRDYDESYLIGTEGSDINYEAVIAKEPQLMITSEVYDYQTTIDQLAQFDIPVVVCKAYDTTNFFKNMEFYGELFGQQEKAREVCDYFQGKLDYINEQLQGVEKKRVYFEYRNPGRTTIEGDSFFNMVEYAYAENLFKDSADKNLDLEAVVAANPDYIVKVSEPDVPFTYEPPSADDFVRIKEEISTRAGWDEINAVKNDNILLLSGYVQGGGAKLVGTFYVAKFLYPDLLPELNPEEVFSHWLELQGIPYISGHTSPAYELEQ